MSAMDGEDRWESGINTSIGDAVLSMARRLPSIWSTAGESGRLAAELVEYPGRVQPPDSETIYSWIEGLCSVPHRRPGTPEGRWAEEWVAERLSGFGLERVTADPIPITVWSPERWSLTVGNERIPSFFIVNTAFTGSGGVRAPLAYAGKGKPREIEKAGVEGKIVVAEVPFPRIPVGLLMKLAHGAYYLSDPDHSIKIGSSQYLNFVRQNFIGGALSEKTAPDNDVYWNSRRAGAAGVCLILRDQPGGINSHYGPYDGIMKPIPGLWIGKHDAGRLREFARNGRVATLTLEGRTEEGEMRNVWGVLPGRSDEVILVTSHHDSPFLGAVEDGSGVAQVLAQAMAWSRVPKSKRPRTIVFVIDAGHFYGSEGATRFARQHPEIMEKTRVLITLEHLAAKEVRQSGHGYAETGGLATTVMFTSPRADVIAPAIRALKERPARVTAVIPSDLFGPAPTSDASGYVVEAGVPVISWIGCPYYLLDEHDTLDKIEKSELEPIAETVTEMIGLFMAMET